MRLAIGFDEVNAVIWSQHVVDSMSNQDIADFMARRNHGKYPEQLLLVGSTMNGLINVEHHLMIDKEYVDKEEGHA